MEDKLKNKIAELKEQLSEERELRKSLQRELNDARKLLGKARALADKMSGACSALIEAVEDDSDKKPGKDDSDKKPRGNKKGGDKKPNKGGDKKPGKPNKGDREDKPSKGDSKKPSKDGKKPSKVVKLTEDDEDDAPRIRRDKRDAGKKPSKDGKKGGDKKPSKDGKKGDSKKSGKDSIKVKGKAPKKVKNEVDLDDDYED